MVAKWMKFALVLLPVVLFVATIAWYFRAH